MNSTPSNLPDDVEALRAIIAAQAVALAQKDAELQSRDLLIEKLKARLAVLRSVRSVFGKDRTRH